MAKHLSIGLDEALALTLDYIRPLPPETTALVDAVDRIAAQELGALVDSPSVDASLKDGYAVLAREVAGAGPERPVRLKLAGKSAAGGRRKAHLAPGTTVRVLTGARIPAGADAVVAEEFTRAEARGRKRVCGIFQSGRAGPQYHAPRAVMWREGPRSSAPANA